MVKVRALQPINTDGSINLKGWLDHVLGMDPALDRDALKQACEFARAAELALIAPVWCASCPHSTHCALAACASLSLHSAAQPCTHACPPARASFIVHMAGAHVGVGPHERPMRSSGPGHGAECAASLPLP